jgi:hypothetical protein
MRSKSCFSFLGETAKEVVSRSNPQSISEAIARSRSRTLDEIMASGGLLRWQAELVQAAVEKTLHAAREKVSSRK